MEALIGQLFNGINPAVLSWYRDRTGIAQKLQRLNMLVTKIRSVVEVSEKIKITAENLRNMQQIFRDAATKGAEVHQKFQDHQVMNNSSSRISNLFEGLISKKEDVGDLNSTLEWLEQLSAEVKDFLETLNKMGKWEVPLEKRRKSESVFIRDEKKYEKEKKKEEVKNYVVEPLIWDPRLSLPPTDWYGYRYKQPFPLPPTSWFNHHGAPSQSPIPSVPNDYTLKNAFIEYLVANTPKVSKRRKGKSPVPDSGSDELERSSEDERKDGDKDKAPKREKAPKEEKKIVFKRIDEMEMQSSNPSHLLTRRKIEVDAVGELAAKIQRAIERAKKMTEHGSCFNRWIAQLEDAIKEGNSVAEAIKSNDFCMDDQIADEVGVILAAVRSRLESIVANDLDDFQNLVTISKNWV